MNQLQTTDQQLIRAIMEEYEDTLRVVESISSWNNNYIGHIPTFTDVVQMFSTLDMVSFEAQLKPAESSFDEVVRVAQEQRILFKVNGGHINFPLVEVW